MTVAQEATDGLTWSALLTAATQVAVLLAALAGGYWGLRRWVQRAAQDSEQAVRQTATNNGHTVGQLSQTAVTKLEELAGMARDNRTRLDALDARLDRHIVAGHREE